MRRVDRNVSEIVEETIELICLTVVDAIMEAAEPEPRNDEVIRALYPPFAIVRAIRVALDVAT